MNQTAVDTFSALESGEGYRVEPFCPVDARLIEVQSAQKGTLHSFTREFLTYLSRQPSRTIWYGDRPLACGGAIPMNHDRVLLWATVGQAVRRHMMVLFREAERFIQELPHRRIECVVECDFKPGHRLARMLGFMVEAPRMRAYDPDGRDYSLYAKVRVD